MKRLLIVEDKESLALMLKETVESEGLEADISANGSEAMRRLADGRRYAFTLSAGLSLVAPQARLGGIHCYLEGDPAPVAAALGLHPAGEADGAVHLLAPYDPGVFYGPLDKAGLKVVCLPQLYADLVHYERRGPEQAEHLRREAMGY